MDPLDHSQELLEYRDLKENGYFWRAALKLEDILCSERENRSDIVLELADTWLLHGSFTKAFDCTETYLRGFTGSETPDSTALRMVRAFALAHTQGLFKEGLELVDNYEGTRSHAHGCEMADSLIVGEQYRWQLWYLALEIGLVSAESKPVLDLNVLRSVFDDSIALRKYSNAGKIASVSIYGGDSDFVVELFQRLVYQSDVPQVLRGKALGWLGSLYHTLGDVVKSRDLNQQARLQFQETKHAYAIAKWDLEEAHQAYIGQIDELSDPVERYVAICVDIMYTRGILEEYGRLQKLCIKAKLTPVALQFSAELEETADRAGSKVLRDQARLDCIDAWNTLSDHGGQAISNAVAVYESLKNSDCFPLVQRAAQLAAKSYANLKDCEQAAYWAGICVEESRHCSKLVQSRAALAFLECEFLNISDLGDAGRKYEAAMEFVQAEVAKAEYGLALSMLNVLLMTLTSAKARFGVDCSEYVSEVVQRTRWVQSKLPFEESQEVSPLFLHAQAVELVQQSKNSLDISKEERAIELVRKARRMRFQAKEYVEAAKLSGLLGTIYHKIVGKFRTSDGYTDVDLVRKYLRLASQQYSLAVQTFENYKEATNVARFKQYEAKTLYESWVIGDVSHQVVLERIRDAQFWSDRVREELSALGGLSAIENKQRLGAISTTRSGFSIALHVATQEGMALCAWDWTQKAKARSLCEFLGSDLLVPKELLSQIAADEEALALYEWGRQKQQHFLESESSISISNQIELEEHVQKMREHPLLKTLTDLREGVPISMATLQQELRRLKASLEGRGIILADWIVRDDEIWLLTVKESGEPALQMLTITVPVVKEWIRFHLQASGEHESCLMTDGRDEQHPMRTLTPLVEPLVNASQPEDILVLSPTETLHSLPLHALLVSCERGQMPLIERNPVVYAASITTFVQCCQKARDNATREDLATSFLEAYEDFAGYDFELAEQSLVQGLMTQLAGETGGEYHHGSDLHSRCFSDVAERSRMLFFHGHCDLEADDIKRQGLRLFPNPSREIGNSELFPVPSFFDLKLRHAPHMTLMACASTLQAITPGDEPLGLVTALLCAGAASVLGPMWPVQSRTARAFTERFVANWDGARYHRAGDKDGGGKKGKERQDESDERKCWLNLAVAVREAVLDLREGVRTKEVWHWGGFILHGSFFCRDVW